MVIFVKSGCGPHRDDCVVTKNSRVCEHHFNKKIIWHSTYSDEKSRKVVQWNQSSYPLCTYKKFRVSPPFEDVTRKPSGLLTFEGISDLNSQYFQVKLSEIQTNIVVINLDPKFNPKDVQKRIATVYPGEPVKICVKCSARDHWIRFVTCWEVTDEDTRLATEKIVFVLKEFEQKFQLDRKNSEELEQAYLQTQAVIEIQKQRCKL